LKVTFRTRKLQRAFEESARAVREFGPEAGRSYIQRIIIIKAAKSLEDLKVQRSLRCHELQGKRAGQWAMNLTHRFRLVFTMDGSELDVVRIEEVSNHYGD
jgi:proteic killer suppression protein